MNLLDENIVNSQRQMLRGWRIRFTQVGYEAGHSGIQDDQIIPLLHQLGQPTFFTRDLGFYSRRLCHQGYCLVCLAVEKSEVAVHVRRFLRHPDFNTQAKRMGAVVRVSRQGLHVWRLRAHQERFLDWSE